jgi:hypothetical protein
MPRLPSSEFRLASVVLVVLVVLPACGEAPTGSSAEALTTEVVVEGPSAPGHGTSSGYLFDLTDAEISAVRRRYAPSTSLEDLRHVVRPPFDCARHGELCQEVGSERGQAVLESMWRDARAGLMTRDELDDAVEVDLAQQAAAEFDARFPLGAPAGDPYFGALGGVPGCDRTVTVESGDRRVRVRATLINLGLGSRGSVGVTHFALNANGRWRRASIPTIEADGTVIVSIATGGPAQSIAIEDARTNSSRAVAAFTYVGTGSVPFVEGCGGVSPSSPLWACACSGTFPGGGGGGGSGGGSGGLPGDGL